MVNWCLYFFSEKALERDNFMSPIEAQNFGVIDHVLAQTPVAVGDESNKENNEK